MTDNARLARVLQSVEAGAYKATPEELAGIERALRAAREGRFATDDQIKRLFEKHQPVGK